MNSLETKVQRPEVSEHPFVLSEKNKTHKGLLKRKRAEMRFRAYGIISIVFSVAFLMFLLGTILGNGISAFEKTIIKVRVDMEPELVANKLEPTLENIEGLNFRKIISDSFKERLPEAVDRTQVLDMQGLISRGAYEVAKNKVINKFKKTGQVKDIVVWLPTSSAVDMVMKDKLDLSIDEGLRKISDFQLKMIKKLKFEKAIKRTFNWDFLTTSDSREPEQAGIYGAIVGSFFVIIICMVCAMPVGVGAAIYLEEFAPKTRFKTMIEIAINNLAAIPSIVYGLLGLAIFLNIAGLPRSSALAGGLTLALMVLPVIIVSTRNSIASVPPSIKDAATALGASKMQVVFHHVLPLSLPGIMTGSILSMARALGETAPLLLIGMVAFVRDVPERITEPASALPVQIFLWSDLPEQGFVEKTSAAIIVLLLFLIVANGLAVYLRRKFEYKW